MHYAVLPSHVERAPSPAVGGREKVLRGNTGIPVTVLST